jgi:limonene-1,2-epoxide hydrolase
MTNSQLVLDFIRAWEARDAQAILGMMAPDVVYHNIPMPPMTGHAAVRQFIGPFLAMSKRVEWQVHAIAETAQGVVLTERTDIFELANGKTVTLPVMGAFEIADGKINRWRDYFDPAQFQGQMA